MKIAVDLRAHSLERAKGSEESPSSTAGRLKREREDVANHRYGECFGGTMDPSRQADKVLCRRVDLELESIHGASPGTASYCGSQ